MKIALDAMGGDFGPPNLVGGAVLALREYPQIEKLFLVGDTPQIEAELKKLNCNDRRIEIVHSTQVVEMSDGAVASVRRKKDSSVSRAVDLVKKGDAAAIVSAGHTGAAVAATTIKLRTLPGIDRPGHLRAHSLRNQRLLSLSTPARTATRDPSTCCNTASWAPSIRATSSATKIRASA